MEIRRIKPEEKQYSDKISAVSFMYERDFAEDLKCTEGYENVWAAFNDDGTLCTSMTAHPFTVMFDGSRVPMAGLGGVASLPEHRKGGAVREMIKAAMLDMKEQGQVFSYLYPFSHAFYRKFGYEICFARTIAAMPITEFRELPKSGQLSFFQKGGDLKPYEQVYSAFIADKNLALVRTREQFEHRFDHDPYKSKRYTYLWCSDAGEPKSYLSFSPIRNDKESTMNVLEFVFADAEGMLGMLGHIGVFSAQLDTICWEVPDVIDLYALVLEPKKIKVERQFGGMNRIIDAEKALALMKVPQGAGAVTIEVTDDFLPFNSGTYAIEWKCGSLFVSKTDADADIAVSAGSLAQLITGYTTPAQAAFAGAAQIVGNADMLGKLFVKKHLYISDMF